MAKVRISFDIDGTLIRSVGERKNYHHRRSFTHAFKEVAGLDDVSTLQVPHHGCTDIEITLALLGHHGIDEEKSSTLVRPIIESIARYADRNHIGFGEGLELIPGVKETLAALHAAGVEMGLVTGNVAEVAYAKMSALGIREFFTFGAFGGDHASRDKLVHIALSDATRNGYVTAHVGDAPTDVLAGLRCPGVKAIGVETGIFSEADLRTACLSASDVSSADVEQRFVVIADGVGDTVRFLAAVGL